MCTNHTPTKNADWIKNQFAVDLPANYPVEAYLGFLATVVMKIHLGGRLACGLARFGLIPARAVDEKICHPNAVMGKYADFASSPAAKDCLSRQI